MFNNILQLKNVFESYTTLDLCAIDIHKSIVSFFKLGAFTTFIIRDNIVTEVNNYSLPLGIIEHINVIPSSYKIKQGDQKCTKIKLLFAKIAEKNSYSAQANKNFTLKKDW